MCSSPLRKPYPSDVSDDEWSLVVPYLTLMTKTAPQRDHALRELFNALRYVIRYGIAWRAMPNDLPPWSFISNRSAGWRQAASRLAQDLRAVLRMAGNREPDPTAAIIDSRTLRSTPETAPALAMMGPSASAVRRCEGAPGRRQARPPACAARDTGDVGDRAAVDNYARTFRTRPANRSNSPTSIKVTPVRPPSMRPGLRASHCTSSSCPKLNAVSSCCRAGGWWSGRLRGRHAAAGWSKTTSGMPQHSQAFTSSHSSDTCSNKLPS